MRPYVTPTPTPIWDRLMAVTNGNTLATYNARRVPKGAGEWDTLAAWPLRKRQRLTSGGLMSRWGMKPDEFADMLRTHGGSQVGDDPIAWYLREADRALREKQAAATVDQRRRRAKAAGLRTFYEYRQQQARDAGYETFWEYRKARGWT